MKRLFVLASMLVLLTVMVSSVVRADSDPNDPVPKTSNTVSVMNSDPDDPVPVARGAVLVADVSLNPPPGSDVDPDTKATPVLF